MTNLASPEVAIEDLGTSRRERALQRIFDDWGGERDGCRVAGAPLWLLNCKSENQRGTFYSENFYSSYRYVPDVIWTEPEPLVLELKCAPKYEPLALAEVLHHAWHVKRLIDDEGNAVFQSLTPALVSSGADGSWQRAALAYLFDAGLPKSAIRYLEVSYYERRGEHYLWFEEPFAAWLPVDAPPLQIAQWDAQGVRWYRLDGSDSWIGIRSDPPARPCAPKQFCMLSRIDGEDRYLVHSQQSLEEYATYIASR